jgi:hypothetical protein
MKNKIFDIQNLNWFFKPGKSLLITLPIFLDILIVGFTALVNSFNGALFMFKIGGLLIYFISAGFLFALFPIVIFLVYFRFPYLRYEKMKDKYPQSSLKPYLFTLLQTVALRVGVASIFYLYNLLIKQ